MWLPNWSNAPVLPLKIMRSPSFSTISMTFHRISRQISTLEQCFKRQHDGNTMIRSCAKKLSDSIKIEETTLDFSLFGTWGRDDIHSPHFSTTCHDFTNFPWSNLKSDTTIGSAVSKLVSYLGCWSPSLRIYHWLPRWCSFVPTVL